jgi:hypothetical protein
MVDDWQNRNLPQSNSVSHKSQMACRRIQLGPHRLNISAAAQDSYQHAGSLWTNFTCAGFRISSVTSVYEIYT